MIDGFTGPIVLGDRPAVAAEDGLAVLAIVLAAYQSGAEGRPIRLAGSQATTAVLEMVDRQ
jgi:predicted dehydrogenase